MNKEFILKEIKYILGIFLITELFCFFARWNIGSVYMTITYGITCILAYIYAREWSKTPYAAILVAVAFTFLPFHYYEYYLEGSMLGFMFIPIVIGESIQCIFKKSLKKYRICLCVVAVTVISIWNMQTAIMCVWILFFCAGYACLAEKNIISALIMTLILEWCCAIILWNCNHNLNYDLFNKGGYRGIPFMSLFLPIYEHRIGFVQNLTQRYANVFGIEWAVYFSCGCYISFGIIILLCRFWIKRYTNNWEHMITCMFLFIFILSLYKSIGIFAAFFTNNLLSNYSYNIIILAWAGAMGTIPVLDKLFLKLQQHCIIRSVITWGFVWVIMLDATGKTW